MRRYTIAQVLVQGGFPRHEPLRFLALGTGERRVAPAKRLPTSSTMELFSHVLPLANALESVHNQIVDTNRRRKYDSNALAEANHQRRRIPSVRDLVDVQHSLGHIDCAACERTRSELMEWTISPDSTVENAAQQWLAARSIHIEPGTYKSYQEYIRAMLKFFAGMKLSDIHAGMMAEYQRQRRDSAGPQRINHECNTLAQILHDAGLWEAIKPYYKPMRLKRPGSVGRALSPEDAKRLFNTAAQAKRWRVAYWASIISANTTAGPGEIRHLRLGDIDLVRGDLFVNQGLKNENRQRRIPLNASAKWALTEAVARAKELGAYHAEHYLFPARAKSRGKYAVKTHDVTKPQGSWKKAWYALTAAAGLKGLRRYDLRHHAITAMLENPNISEQTVKDIAGQVSKRILQHYSHIRIEAKRAAVSALEQIDTGKRPSGIGLITSETNLQKSS